MTKPKLCGGLGFRDIELYDLAPLARQAWRILHVTDSLSACVLSAVYYPQGDFLGVGLGARPSRIWRAIIHGVQRSFIAGNHTKDRHW